MSNQQPEDLAQELRELGQQLKELVGAATQNRRTKEYEEKISRAVQDLSTQIDRAVKSAKESKPAKKVKKAGGHVKETAQAWKESGAREDIERGLAKSVRVLNEQIRRAVAELKSPRETESKDMH